MANTDKRVCLGAFAGAHGVRGDTLIKTFTDIPANIAAYGPVTSEDGSHQYTLTFLRETKPGFAVLRVKELTTREQAMAVKGVRLYVERSTLPAAAEDEFYLEDLVGLNVVDETNAPAGVIAAIHNFGAGDLIEIKDIPETKGVRILEFTRENFPTVAISEQAITVLRSAIDAQDDSTLSEEIEEKTSGKPDDI